MEKGFVGIEETVVVVDKLQKLIVNQYKLGAVDERMIQMGGNWD